MKKFVSLVVVAVMLSATVFGATTASFDRENDIITVNYDYSNDSQATVMAYEVANGSTTAWDGTAASIIGIGQEAATGAFEIPMSADYYNGYVAIAVGGENITTTRTNIAIENGIPATITTEYDAEGEELVLAEGHTLTVNAALKNAIVDATAGKVSYKNANEEAVTITGNIYFDAEGAIDAAADGDIVTLELDAEGENKTVAFITKDTLDAEDTGKTITLTGSDKKTKTAAFEFEGLEGTVNFHILVQNVPDGVTIVAE